MNPLHFDETYLHFGLGIKTYTSVTDKPEDFKPDSIPTPELEPDNMKGNVQCKYPSRCGISHYSCVVGRFFEKQGDFQ